MISRPSMLLALHSLEDVYVRGRTVHLVGNGHRFYGNIECESASDLLVGDLLEVTAGVLEDDQGWEVCLEIVADADMGRHGREHVRLRFTDRSQAESVREAFLRVAALIQGN
jgi:hypothetical protein